HIYCSTIHFILFLHDALPIYPCSDDDRFSSHAAMMTMFLVAVDYRTSGAVEARQEVPATTTGGHQRSTDAATVRQSDAGGAATTRRRAARRRSVSHGSSSSVPTSSSTAAATSGPPTAAPPSRSTPGSAWRTSSSIPGTGSAPARIGACTYGRSSTRAPRRA